MKLPYKLTFILLLLQLQFISCKKDDCGSCVSPPKPTPKVIAKAGLDQVMTLPKNYTPLDGSQSTVNNGKITSYKWSKVWGPTSFHILDVTAVQTEVTNLTEGEYGFELTVTAEGGMYSKDTVKVIVNKAITFVHWTRLGQFPQEQGDWFNGSNFLMGINNQLFAVTNKGSVWQLSGSIIWNNIASFPEPMQFVPVVFSIHTKGYCIGISGGTSHLWQYDLAGNLWQRKKDVPDHIREANIALVIEDKVYLVAGYTNQVMKYDPSTDTYFLKKNFLGTEAVTGVVINGEGFCIGADGTCWKYDPVTDSWQQKATLPPSILRMKGFSLKDDGYVIGDWNDTAYSQSKAMKLWRYDVTEDKWYEFEEDYPGFGVYEINTVSTSDQVFIGLGYTNGDFPALDIWRFD